MDEKKIPESHLPEHSQLSSQETLADEELSEVAGGRLSLLNSCSVCGTDLKGGVCPSPNCPSNQ